MSWQIDGGSHSKQFIKNEIQNISTDNYYGALILFEITILEPTFFFLVTECSLNISQRSVVLCY